ncbi:hypothetical protein NDU88_001534 [Pleurodeles waltl]|uniref:Uncharacterized protein n=1 Tax=Pleurodeles waltl TaxID=8319 RepID=A0AAV7RBJ7_PLEWA|nr:hypothetical protein NDU88_001534 [Pleurodeles waltl]
MRGSPPWHMQHRPCAQSRFSVRCPPPPAQLTGFFCSRPPRQFSVLRPPSVLYFSAKSSVAAVQRGPPSPTSSEQAWWGSLSSAPPAAAHVAVQAPTRCGYNTAGSGHCETQSQLLRSRQCVRPLAPVFLRVYGRGWRLVGQDHGCPVEAALEPTRHLA